jgi:hypothetical protein
MGMMGMPIGRACEWASWARPSTAQQSICTLVDCLISFQSLSHNLEHIMNRESHFVSLFHNVQHNFAVVEIVNNDNRADEHALDRVFTIDDDGDAYADVAYDYARAIAVKFGLGMDSA